MPQIFRSLPRGTDSGTDRARAAAAEISKFERVCGEIRALSKDGVTGRMVFFSRSSHERALTHYVAHYHEERNHQGLQNRLLKCSDATINLGSRVERRERLGGMLNFYHGEAA